ncbi:MAG: Trk system potassium transporter TrkA [Proteobacteria bacterium]|nr:MAG: Trk system potassium transporter TrkA [Pseudomonadota bacterium]
MKVIICGAGQVGYHIAKHLATEHNDVTVIERSAQLIDKIRASLDVKAIQGHASHPDMLEQAGAADADMVIAVTQADEVNMLACQVAHSLFNVPTKVARIRAQSYLDPLWSDLFSRDHMPIDVVISPEIEVARAILRRLEVPGAFDMIPFAGDRVRIVGIKLGDNCPVVNTPLRQLTELFPDLRTVVVGVEREDRLIVPTGDDQLLVGDNIYVTVDTKHMDRTLSVFGHEELAARRVLIIGGGNIGLFLAQQIQKTQPKVNIKIIELSAARAEFVAEQLPDVVVMKGDALDVELLKEANVEETETIVTVTNEDEVNILSALLGKRNGAQKAITLINNQTYGPLLNSLGIDVFVDPRESTVSSILQLMRRGRIRALRSLSGGRAEAVEGDALETSLLVGKPLREIRLPTGITVGAIIRRDEVIMPRGGTVIEVGDRVIVFATANMVRKVEEMFSVRIEFF